METCFSSQSRQQFRQYFQPSRLVVGVVSGDSCGTINLITLSFNTHCSYKPLMMAFSIHNSTYSYPLFQRAAQCVLAVPGEGLAQEVLECGILSGRRVNKLKKFNLKLEKSQNIDTQGLRGCIANIELVIRQRIEVGDSMMLIAEVMSYRVNTSIRQRNLLSLGPRTAGYEVLASKGIHRIGAYTATRS
ncbi:MAG: hypothetical protein DRR06_00560 [Gammaproteobacteria bacterium]|nr:MAG: hypothetical protein DRQ54_05710 [Gammaproteobacteria bacterium]RLA48073.1 MAG: hypothetical protein DRR06_00560 [Gammaproteobacteria bacterium]